MTDALDAHRLNRLLDDRRVRLLYSAYRNATEPADLTLAALVAEDRPDLLTAIANVRDGEPDTQPDLGDLAATIRGLTTDGYDPVELVLLSWTTPPLYDSFPEVAPGTERTHRLDTCHRLLTVQRAGLTAAAALAPLHDPDNPWAPARVWEFIDRFGPQALDDCMYADLDTTELDDILTTGDLPDAEALAVMRALHQ